MTRQEVEKQAARKVVTALLEAGYMVDVENGEEIVLEPSSDVETIMKALGSTDIDYLSAFKGEEPAGTAMLVWGNGEDLLSDYTLGIREALDPLVE